MCNSLILTESRFSDALLVLNRVEEETKSDLAANNCPDDDSVETQWVKYWDEFGPWLTWQNWVESYKDFMDPEYLKPNNNFGNIAWESSSLNSVPKSMVAEVSSDLQWASVWEDHKQIQFTYYKKWFYQWWAEVHQTDKDIGKQPELTPISCCGVDNEDLHQLTLSMIDLSTTTEKREQDMEGQRSEVVCEQKDKSPAEKTEKLLSELGFCSTVNQSESSISGCIVKFKKKKKKRKKPPKKNVTYDRFVGFKSDSIKFHKVIIYCCLLCVTNFTRDISFQDLPIALADSEADLALPRIATSACSSDETVCGNTRKEQSEMKKSEELKKYWAQRYRLFSLFDNGIRLDHGKLCLFICCNLYRLLLVSN